VGISGTDYVPPVPDTNEVEKELEDLLSSDMSNTEKAITAFLWGARRQMFWDGNKRTSLLLANKILVANGNGILTINERNMAQFNELLVAYYNTDDMGSIKMFLYENAISGIDFKTPVRDEHQKNER
jgi:prophage maintenance system killer protein